MTDNPLLDFDNLPKFHTIQVEHIMPAVQQQLEKNRSQLVELLSQPEALTWDNLLEPLERMNDHLDRIWSPVRHLNSVMNTPELRAAYDACLPLLSAWETELGQNKSLYNAVKNIHDSPAMQTFSKPRQKIIQNYLRDFHLAGVDLPEEKQKRFKEIKKLLAGLKSRFEQNVLDATQSWTRHITDNALLSGLPDSALEMASQAAKRKELEGWLFTLEFPSYFAVMTYADNADLRREMYFAYTTRASDQGPDKGRFDNTDVMQEIIALRQEMASLLGFAHYADCSLATKMADSAEHVTDFLEDLARKAKPFAVKELAEVEKYAREKLEIEKLQAWDISYASEKLREHLFELTQEQLKPWFPARTVLNGLFELLNQLFNMRVIPVPGVETWHSDVEFYEIRDQDDRIRGQFYLDLYTRPDKRGGAWMDECISRHAAKGVVQLPVAYLTCNLTPPIGNKPALFTHQEVITLFHEFGHGIHHMLTTIDDTGVAGIRGVPWDAVELPSQFMENWCWEEEALNHIARHYQTNEPLPGHLLDKMIRAKNFQSAMQMLRQIEFALFDFTLHMNPVDAPAPDIQAVLNHIRQRVAVFIPPDFNRFQHGFTHIFSGGYAAGYYSYKWAEVLSADAFSMFEEKARTASVIDKSTGEKFLHTILEKGGSEEILDLFVQFRGRQPDISALLRHSGLNV